MSTINDAYPRFSEGLRLFRAGDYEAAIKEFTAAIAIYPDHLDAYSYRADAYGYLRMEEEAKADLEQVGSIKRARRRAGRQEAAQQARQSQVGEGRGFKKAFAWTAIPIVPLAIISTSGANLVFPYFLWFLGAAGWLLAGLVAIAFLPRRRWNMVAGVFAGFGVGFLALAATCLANVAPFPGLP